MSSLLTEHAADDGGPDKTTLKLLPSELDQPVSIALPRHTLYIDKSEIGRDANSKLNFNVLAVARKHPELKRFVSRLASAGFFLIEHSDGLSRFERLRDHHSFKPFVGDGDIKLWNETYYTLQAPQQTVAPARLLVVFSSLADSPLNARISKRMFFKNFATISKYVPQNTHVLRIVDLGSVLGSFYLNSKFDPAFENKVQALIAHVREAVGVRREDVVLYGTSKGATGALFHGITGNYACVAVDPIVSDVFYLEKCNDLHYVEGNFELSKQERFASLLDAHQSSERAVIITSRKSEQFPYITQEIVQRDAQHRISVLSFQNPRIESHPDVGAQTVNIQTAMINNHFYGFDAPRSGDFAC